MELGEVAVHMEYYNIIKFYQILMKNKKKIKQVSDSSP